LDEKTILDLAKRIKKVITIEENTREGGFGSAVLELLQKNNVQARVKRIAVADKFIEHGSQDELRKIAGLTKENLINAIHSLK
jgi:1-deoxy-D-xylulose-5-phosphate synthase